MEGVEGMMKKLQLSKEEKKIIKFDAGFDVGGKERPPQAMAKLLSERVVRPEVIEQAVGWIWCPAKGINCKDLGDNLFLITFNQASGKRKALEDGPWTISKDLLVMSEFDESKSLDEFDFSFIPIWIRVERLPLGMMNSATARLIGDDIGDFMEVEAEDGVLAAGRALRLKIRLDIRKPLRRGITADLGGTQGERWCPITYEYLPEFCYTCGIIGHVDRLCDVKLGKDEPAPYNKELRFVPPRKPFGGLNPRSQEYRGGINGRSGGSGSWRSGGSGSWGSGDRSRADGSSWRKDQRGSEKKLKGKEDGEEVTSPMKGILLVEKKDSAARTELFPPVADNLPQEVNV